MYLFVSFAFILLNVLNLLTYYLIPFNNYFFLILNSFILRRREREIRGREKREGAGES